MLFIKHLEWCLAECWWSRWMGLHWIAGLISPGLCSLKNQRIGDTLEGPSKVAYKQVMVTSETAVPRVDRQGSRETADTESYWLTPALTPWPFLQVGHQHRAAPVCPAVPAALHETAQCQRVWAGRTRAPAVPPQHDLEDLAHLYPGRHPHRGEVPSLLPMAHSKQCPLFLPESNLQSKVDGQVT